MTHEAKYGVHYVGYSGRVLALRNGVELQYAVLDFVSGYALMFADRGWVSVPDRSQLCPFIQKLPGLSEKLRHLAVAYSTKSDEMQFAGHPGQKAGSMISLDCGDRLVVTEDYEESLARVMAGQATAAALNASAGGRIAARLFPAQFTIPKIMFYEQPLALGVPKGQSAKIIAQLDAGLAAIRADGTWKQINDRWLGQ